MKKSKYFIIIKTVVYFCCIYLLERLSVVEEFDLEIRIVNGFNLSLEVGDLTLSQSRGSLKEEN